jgi:HEAT repeat protein
MMHTTGNCRLWLVVWFALNFCAGCAEGPLSGVGGLTPWVRQQWAEEERYAQSLYGRRDQLRMLAARAKSLPVDQQEQVSRELAASLESEPIGLVRIEVVRALAKFPTATAAGALRAAAKDQDPDVRIAACQAWAERRQPDGVAVLQEVLGSDTDQDVRLAAARALGSLGDAAAVPALGLALDDPDPAMQYRAVQSLRAVSDRDFRLDVNAWRQFARGGNPPAGDGTSVVERRNSPPQ